MKDVVAEYRALPKAQRPTYGQSATLPALHRHLHKLIESGLRNRTRFFQ